MEEIEVVVVGAGVVGLACARALALAGRRVLVVEAEPGIGRGISARNSEVVHRGLYYPAGSRKARHCLDGRRLLLRYCEERAIAHRRCGKLVVATEPGQRDALAALQARARAHGVDDLVALSAAEARAREPALQCVAALHSPGSAIVDAHALMLALQADLEAAGGLCVFHTEVSAVRCGDGHVLHTRDINSDARWALRCRWLVNAAGLGAQRLAARMTGFPAALVPALHLAKGSYFALAGAAPFRQLVYPLPEPGGLGVHVTLDLHGRARFGPDVEWIDRPDYRVDLARGEAFYAAIRRYWPGLPDGALQAAYAGIRPKLRPAGGGDSDFRIHGPLDHGVEGVVQLFGIESPGLTASLSIAAEVAAIVEAAAPPRRHPLGAHLQLVGAAQPQPHAGGGRA